MSIFAGRLKGHRRGDVFGLIRVGGDYLALPEALPGHLLLAQLAGVVAANRADRLLAGVGVDENVSLAAEVGVEHLLQLFDLPVHLLEGEIPGQDQVEVAQHPAAGAPGPEAVDVDPGVFAVLGQDLGDLLQEFGFGGVHEPLEGLAEEHATR